MADATETESSLRQCPTRIDGAAVRIAQHVPQALCQDRQRGLYHKCFLCAHANGRVLQGDVEAAARAVTRATLPPGALHWRARDDAHATNGTNGASGTNGARKNGAAANGVQKPGALTSGVARNGSAKPGAPGGNGPHG